MFKRTKKWIISNRYYMINNNPSKRIEVRRKLSLIRRNHKHSQQTKTKIKKSNISFWKNNSHLRKGKRNPFYGKNHSKQSKEKIKNSQYHKNLKGINNPNFGNHKLKGHKLTEQQRLNISLSKMGDKNPAYIHGLTKLSYPRQFRGELKEKIKVRDNYTCQNLDCGITEKEHVAKYNQILHVHHIDYDKFNCSESNLITACLRCNIQANTNRDYWFAYYTYLIENKR